MVGLSVQWVQIISLRPGGGLGGRDRSRDVHSKNSQVRFDLERVPWCQTHFWARLMGNLGQTDTKSESKCLSHSDSGSVWPGFLVDLASRDPFRVKSDPEVFRVYNTDYNGLSELGLSYSNCFWLPEYRRKTAVFGFTVNKTVLISVMFVYLIDLTSHPWLPPPVIPELVSFFRQTNF